MSTISRRRYPSFLRFVGEDADGSSTPNPDEFLPGDAELDDDAFKAKRGFPRGTPKDDMEPSEVEHYWRYESKKQQHRAEALARDIKEWSKLGDRDALLQAQADAEAARVAALPDAERAAEAAKNDGIAAGAASARDKYLLPAVKGYLVAARPDGEKHEDAAKRIDGALAYVDLSKFLTADAAIDEAALAKFAESIAPATPAAAGGAGAGDPLFQMLNRQTPPAAGQGGSIAEIRKATAKRLSGDDAEQK